MPRTPIEGDWRNTARRVLARQAKFGFLAPLDRRRRSFRGRRNQTRATWLRVAALSLLMFLLAGCGSDPGSAPPEASLREGIVIEDELRTWTHQVGLIQSDPDVWEVRFEEICVAQRDGSGAALEALAIRYIEEDAHLSVRTDPGESPVGDLPTTSDAVDSLVMIAGSVCA